MTVRRVVNILADRGMVVAEQGRGTFVKPLELSTATFDLDRLEYLFHDEGQSTVKILEARITPADEKTARKLSIANGDRTVFIRRLISHGTEPVLLHREHMIYDPTRPIIEAELGVTAMSGLLSGGSGSDLKRGDLTISATVLTDEEASLLHTQPGLPAFRLEHIFFDFDDRAVSWGWFICSGDRLRFTATIGVPAQRTNIA
jgi:DNA-binding GntR family transcriptional regulator